MGWPEVSLSPRQGRGCGGLSTNVAAVKRGAEAMEDGVPDLLKPIRFLGQSTLAILCEMGAIALFFFNAFAKMFVLPIRWTRILQQIHFIGMKSLFVVALTGLFSGMVIGLQGYYVLVKFGSETVLGAFDALALIRELGPVLTALMITGRAGSSMAAELGVMRISEQIDALNTMDIDPARFLISPRLAAALVSFPLLTAVFDFIGIVGGYITGVMLLGVNSGTYLAHMEDNVVMKDVTGGFIKSIVFRTDCHDDLLLPRLHDPQSARTASERAGSATRPLRPWSSRACWFWFSTMF